MLNKTIIAKIKTTFQFFTLILKIKIYYYQRYKFKQKIKLFFLSKLLKIIKKM